MVSGSWVFAHSRPAPHDRVVMVIREAVQYDSVSDWLTLTSRVGVVCRGTARRVSTWATRCVTAQGWPNVSSILLDDLKAVRALENTHADLSNGPSKLSLTPFQPAQNNSFDDDDIPF